MFGNQHGCQPITEQIPAKWPLGIDVLRAQLAAIADNRLFAYQQPFIDSLRPTFMIKMLGATGYTTIDPKNLEAMLSTRFEGNLHSVKRGLAVPNCFADRESQILAWALDAELCCLLSVKVSLLKTGQPGSIRVNYYVGRSSKATTKT